MADVSRIANEDPIRERLHRDEQAPHEGPALTPREVAQAAAQLASEKKAEDILLLEVQKLCSYADYFVLCSAPSERQVSAIAKSVNDGLRRGGIKPMGVEGLRQGTWVLIDLGDVVVHAMLESAREYYDLEGFWGDAPRVPFSEEEGIGVLARLGLSRAGEPLQKKHE